MAEKQGYNMTSSVEQMVNNTYLRKISESMMLSNDPGTFVLHPMYVMLQEQSPMGMLRQFELKLTPSFKPST